MVKYIFTPHLKARMQERGVTEGEVIGAIKKAEVTIPCRQSKRKRIISKIKGQSLNVIIEEDIPSGKIIIITVAWL